MAAALRRKNQKKGLSFSMMVVGASGLGKSTFINTLCESEIIPARATEGAHNATLEKTFKLHSYSVELEEDGVRLQLTIIDTPGFGDNIDNEANFNEILAFIERQYDDVLAEETRIKRNPKFQDNRVHTILYFIAPTGHGLRELDIDFMHRLSARVNVIPVVARSDSLTPAELAAFKARVLQDIQHYAIRIYDFPYADEDDEDPEIVEENSELRALLPFAVVGSEQELIVSGRRVRCRRYPWGNVEVDNAQHCDFSKLRYVLFSSHLTDLKEITQDVLYEQFRTERLATLAPDGADVDGVTPLSAHAAAAASLSTGSLPGPASDGYSSAPHSHAASAAPPPVHALQASNSAANVVIGIPSAQPRPSFARPSS